MTTLIKRVIVLLLFISTVAVRAFIPSPTGGPSDSFLTRGTRILHSSNVEQQESKYIDMAIKSEGTAAKPDIVYIIMYNPGSNEEGVHTSKLKDSKKEALLAFESLEECAQFSNIIKADSNFPQEPIPTPTPLVQMEMACQGMDLLVKVVPAKV